MMIDQKKIGPIEKLFEPHEVKIYKQVIGFCGSQATGKTSLAKYFVDINSDQIELCIEGAREAAAELGISNIRDIKPKQRQRFQERILEKHLDALSAFKRSPKAILICDRTVIDILVYTREAIGNLESISDEFYNSLSLLCKQNLYNKIIYFDLIPLSPFEINDGFRDTCLLNRYNIAKDIQFILNYNSINFLRISDDWSDRIKFVQWITGLIW